MKARKARKAREMLLTAVLGPLQPGHLGRLCRRQKRQSGGRLKRPGRLGERSGRLWRCGGRERSCGIVKGRRETVYARVTRKVTESASPRAATRLPGSRSVRDICISLRRRRDRIGIACRARGVARGSCTSCGARPACQLPLACFGTCGLWRGWHVPWRRARSCSGAAAPSRPLISTATTATRRRILACSLRPRPRS